MARFFYGRNASIIKGINQLARCPHCGKPLKRGSVVCVFCKQDSRKSMKGFDTSETTIECPNCKALNEPNSVICSSCGINFIAYEMSEPMDFSGIHNARKRRKH